MDLNDVLKRRTYPFRQHLEETGWTERKPTVVDLSAQQQAALGKNGV